MSLVLWLGLNFQSVAQNSALTINNAGTVLNSVSTISFPGSVSIGSLLLEDGQIITNGQPAVNFDTGQIITDGAGDMTNYGALFTGFQSINSRQGSSSYIDTNGNLVLDWAQTGFIPASSYDNLIINSGSPIWQGLENLDNIIVDSDNIVLNDSTALYLSLSSSFTNFNSIGIFVLNDPFGAVSNSENVVILGTQSQIPVNSVGLNNVLLAPGISATFSNVTLTTGGSFAGPLNGNATTSSGLLTVTNTWAGYLTRVSANTNFPTFFQVWSTNPSAGALLPMGEYVRSNSAAGGYIYNRGGQSTWNTVP